jgi:DNA-binding MarR family transcriptional regulator
VGVADASYMIRRRRDRFFPATLFGEPAWDILLDLYIQGERGTPVSISSACLAGGTAPTTGLRWLSNLDELGLTERKPNASDGRMSWIRLTARGREQMQAYLADIAGEVEDWARGVNDADADDSELMAHAG